MMIMLTTVPIPVAPAKEQHRIVARFDELMANGHRLRAFPMNQASTVSPHLCQRGRQDAYCAYAISLLTIVVSGPSGSTRSEFASIGAKPSCRATVRFQ